MAFATVESMLRCMRDLGVTQVFCKSLAENDNTKQQIYLGGSFEILKFFPYRELHSEPGNKRQNFKAALQMRWIDGDGNTAEAPGAQLILYPDYPEIRLSGFLRGCPTAPSAMLQPVPRASRKHNNGPDGRVMFFGVHPDGTTYAWLAAANSAISREFIQRRDAGEFPAEGVLWRLALLPNQPVPAREELLSRLRSIHAQGWHVSRRLDAQGRQLEYQARNGGGYTLEALLGIRPNAKSAPDYLGWEIKACGSGKVTLMTPEPDAGFYGTHGVEAFVRKYGRDVGGDVLYFTGIHRADALCTKSGQTLKLRGFDPAGGKIVDVGGGIELVDGRGVVSAAWSYRRLIDHWARKHSAAAYVPYTKKDASPPAYRYDSPVLLGEGTEFALYMNAFAAGDVMYDPASKVMNASKARVNVKARSQFRIPIARLGSLYRKFEAVKL